ncbi:hypothetical protein TGAM01_v208634 [Trichoderma gamsii]|uniref:SNF2 N-terminal domain-containing protein n=1 Tax=Trichoderma gamsii TaxID=398673 RepID=A0A2P4ZE50_9HYPO|nr:hypothetical protein TGAM01_v208634 [Trichoderma gamsii]PON22550.1 hypothetical protein TGAM01_v208634 [Trichoderma gamsii]
MGSHLNETSLKRQQPENSNSNDDVQPPRKKAAVLETRKYPPSAISPHEELNIDESRLSCAEDSRTDHSQVASNEDQLVCFGMIGGISGSVSGACRLKGSPTQRFAVQLDSSHGFHCINDASIKGKINLDFINITNACCENEDLTLQVICYVDAIQSSIAPLSTPCRLDMILFGPHSLFEDVGSFFEEYNLYLQDPVGCSQNVLYRNPHRLSAESGPDIWTFNLDKEVAAPFSVENAQTRLGSIDILNSQQDWAETKQPGSIRTKMQSHQLQALTFMLQREQGWAWDGSRADIWELYSETTGSHFINKVSDSVQKETPPQFYGGIIADPMGLGKTLSMISLVASDLLFDPNDPSSLTGAAAEDSTGCTLIVVPPPRISSPAAFPIADITEVLA